MKKKSGFTLIELSIVLVVIGLIVGGVLVAQDLIQAAQLRSIVTEQEQFKAAATTFRLKYNCVAGDCKNAVQFFGQATNCGSSDEGDHDEAGVCDGNGDRYVGAAGASAGGALFVYFSVPRENFQFWKHLAKSGLVSGSFSGNSGADHAYRAGVVGINVPVSRYKNGSWCATSQKGWHFAGDYRNSLAIGITGSTGTTACAAGLLSRKESQMIDSKVDDGMPGKGKVIVHNMQNCSSAGTDPTDFNANYALTTAPYGNNSDAKVCALNFLNAY